MFGRQKNISIVPSELPRAFEYGIAFDASAIDCCRAGGTVTLLFAAAEEIVKLYS